MKVNESNFAFICLVLFGRIWPSDRARARVLMRAARCGFTEERVMEGLEGKIALVTGAGGIGLTRCEPLLGSGGRVFLHDPPTFNGAEKARSNGGMDTG
jgi:hypothetical protein